MMILMIIVIKRPFLATKKSNQNKRKNVPKFIEEINENYGGQTEMFYGIVCHWLQQKYEIESTSN